MHYADEMFISMCMFARVRVCFYVRVFARAVGPVRRWTGLLCGISSACAPELWRILWRDVAEQCVLSARGPDRYPGASRQERTCGSTTKGGPDVPARAGRFNCNSHWVRQWENARPGHPGFSMRMTEAWQDTIRTQSGHN